MKAETFKHRRVVVFLCVFLIIGFLISYVPEATPASEVIKWDVSLWGGPREWTYPIERWAKDMEKLTNGGWQIRIHYGAVLSPPAENIDGL